MPILIEKHQKNVVITRLKKFYTTINQAVRLSEAENGDYKDWDFPVNNDIDSTAIFFNKYLAKYINTLRLSEQTYESVDNDGNPQGYYDNFLTVYLADGSAFLIRESGGIDITFFPEAKNIKKGITPKTGFAFNFAKNNTIGAKSFVEPYTFQWDGTREGLKNHVRYGCNKKHSNFCTKLIQYDGWQIKEDYPW